MQLTFTLKHSGHRRIFREVLTLDEFLRSNKFPKNATVNITTETNKPAGTFLISQYLKTKIMATENPCNTCTRKVITGIRIIRKANGEVQRNYNYNCEGYNIPLFNIQVPNTNHCIRHIQIPQTNTFNN